MSTRGSLEKRLISLLRIVIVYLVRWCAHCGVGGERPPSEVLCLQACGKALLVVSHCASWRLVLLFSYPIAYEM